MALLLYNIFLFAFRIGIRFAALFNPKAKKWLAGRKNILEKMAEAIPKNDKVIWIHCASLGEFEQGRPLIEQLKIDFPDYRILLTFFSPSGYEIQKNYRGADWVFYLPLDGPVTAKKFLEITHPSLVIFVKYEFWFYYLKKLKYRNIPLLLVSALFRPDMSFFQWYGKLQRKMLSRFDHLFVQTASSKTLIDQLGLGEICTVAGDTRFDRVLAIAANAKPIDPIGQFISGRLCLVAGSTWPSDEEILQLAFNRLETDQPVLIIAPHEIHATHIAEIKKLFPSAQNFSGLEGQAMPGNVLIIDNIGMLSSLYRYATIAYIGGGFRKQGLHNTLEAAVYGCPVLFGPRYRKFSEAVGLVDAGAAISFDDPEKNGRNLAAIITKLLNDDEDRHKRAESAAKFVRDNAGATGIISGYIQEKRLLTN